VQLPKLGLDYDTYGPYVVGVFTVGESSNTDAAFDEEELDSVLELLRASSDDHHDDVAWEQLKRDVIAKHEEYTRELQKVQEKQRHEAQLREQERLRHDIEIARTMPVEKKKHVLTAIMDEEQKRALVERFAYEELQEEEEGEADKLVSNKHVAHEANATKTTKESRSAQKTKTTTKREEQAATKQQKLLKMKAKEERRKRATKSERRR
jgi:Tfp pilus assembly major pilin PilA